MSHFSDAIGNKSDFGAWDKGNQGYKEPPYSCSSYLACAPSGMNTLWEMDYPRVDHVSAFEP